MSYKNRFEYYSVEQKRRDLMANPLYDPDKIAKASEDDIITLHREYFETMNVAMLKTIGESIYD